MEVRSYSLGAYSPSEEAILAYDHVLFNKKLPLVVFSHGYGGDGWDQMYDTYGGDIVHAFVDAGFAVVTTDAGGISTWGNAASQTAVGAAITWARGLLGIVPTKVHLLGFSMGGLTSLNYASKVANSTYCVAITNPATNLDWFYANGYATFINTAYGGAGGYGAAYTSTPSNDPRRAVSLGNYPAVPVMIWYSEDDLTVIPTDIMTTKATVHTAGYDALWSFRSKGNTGFGHTPGTTSPQEMLAFCQKNTPPWQ